MSKRGTVPALKDVLEAVERIQRYIGPMGQREFLDHTEKQDAVVRNLEILWDVVKEKLPTLKIQVQEIPREEERKH